MCLDGIFTLKLSELLNYLNVKELLAWNKGDILNSSDDLFCFHTGKLYLVVLKRRVSEFF